MASLDLAWLAVFEEIYKSRNVSQAAERLGLTQGATSTALSRLRAYYGDQLFVRSARGMLPTPRADALYPVLREVRGHLECSRAGPMQFDAGCAERRFTLCMTDITEVLLLPTLMNRLHHLAPRVDIEAERISAESARRLEDGDVDLAVGFIPRLESGFYQRALLSQEFVCIAAQAHPRIRGTISKAQYLGEQHLTVKTSGTGHHVVDETLARHRMHRSIALQVPTFLGVAQIVAESQMIATVPSNFARFMEVREAIQIIPLPVRLSSYQVKLHWHERYHADPANIWLRQVVADIMNPPTIAATAARRAPAAAG
jgi:DNA-binding transcriptional LysR family regulator